MKKFFARLKDYSGLIVVLILLCVIFQAQNQRFLTFDNIIGVMRQLSVYGIVGIGMGFLILNGYLDLTVGSIVGLCGVTVGMLMTRLDMSMWVAMLLTVLVGGIIGLFNGAVITATGIPAFIFTLSMTGVYRGIIYLITKGATINKFEDDFLAIGRSSFLGVPIPIYIFIAVLLIAWVKQNYFWPFRVCRRRKSACRKVFRTQQQTDYNRVLRHLRCNSCYCRHCSRV